MKTDPAKLPRVAEDERLFRLLQDKMIMFAGVKAGLFRAKVAAHPEVNPEPVVPGKDEQHLFSPGVRAQQFLPNEMAFEGADVAAAEDSFLAMQLHGDNLLTEARVPAFAKIFYLGELRHLSGIGSAWPATRGWSFSSPQLETGRLALRFRTEKLHQFIVKTQEQNRRRPMAHKV